MKTLQPSQRLAFRVLATLFVFTALYFTFPTSSAQSLFAQTDGNGVDASVDSDLPQNRTQNRSSVSSIATSSALPNNILLTFKDNPVPTYTTNNGQSWQEVPTAPWTGGNSGKSPSIGLAPRTEAGLAFRILVAAGDGYDTPQNGLYQTGDKGQSWTQQTLPFVECPNEHFTVKQYFTDVTASPVDPTRLYLVNVCMMEQSLGPVAQYYLFKSRDGGVTWQGPGPEEGPHYGKVSALITSPTLPERVYMRPNFWIQSDDGGDSWTERQFPVWELALDADDPARLYGVSVFDYGYIKPRVGMRSEDGGETWVNWEQQPCALGEDPRTDDGFLQLMAHPTQTHLLFLRCKQGLFRSENGGEHWTQLSTESGQLLAPDQGIDGRIFWGKGDGLWTSTDKGTTWQPLMPGYDLVALNAQISLFLPALSTARNPVGN